MENFQQLIRTRAIAGFILVMAILQGDAYPLAEKIGVRPDFSCLTNRTLESGDILFRRGREVASDIVLGMDPVSSFSHVGIVVRRGDRLLVVHAVPAETNNETDAVKEEPIEVFSQPARASAIAVYRLNPSHQANADAIARSVAAAAEKLAARHIPFDADYDLATPERLYCTELVWRLYGDAGVNLVSTPRKVEVPFFSKDVILPSQIQESPLLKPVCRS